MLGMMREADGLEETSSKEYEDKRESTEDQEKGGGNIVVKQTKRLAKIWRTR